MHCTAGLVEHGGAPVAASHSLTSAVHDALDPSVVHPFKERNTAWLDGFITVTHPPPHLFAEAFVSVALVDARPVAAQLLVGTGAAVVRVLRAVDAVVVGRAVTAVGPGQVLASGSVLRWTSQFSTMFHYHFLASVN